MIDIQELKAKAETATQGESEWNTEAPASEAWKENRAANAAFIRAVNPQVVLELLARLERYREALEFYANEQNWSGYHRHVDSIRSDSSPAKASDGFDIMLGGKRAREALKDTP